jgi:hypothetical protein
MQAFYDKDEWYEAMQLPQLARIRVESSYQINCDVLDHVLSLGIHVGIRLPKPRVSQRTR